MKILSRLNPNRKRTVAKSYPIEKTVQKLKITLDKLPEFIKNGEDKKYSLDSLYESSFLIQNALEQKAISKEDAQSSINLIEADIKFFEDFEKNLKDLHKSLNELKEQTEYWDFQVSDYVKKTRRLLTPFKNQLENYVKNL